MHVYDGEAEPTDLAGEVLRSMQQEYDSLEAEAVTEEIGSLEALGYDLEFHFLDFVPTARVRALHPGENTCLVLSQAESRDYDRLSEVFRAITLSLHVGERRE